MLHIQNQVSSDRCPEGAGSLDTEWARVSDGDKAAISVVNAREEAVARLDDLRPGCSKAFSVGGCNVLLIRVDDEVFAVQNRCTHAHSVLGPGRLNEDGLIECPMHGALFSPHDGVVKKGPAKKPITTYPVRLEDGIVFIDMSRSINE